MSENYNEERRDDLYEEAQKRDLDPPSKAKKEDLVEVLQKDDASKQDAGVAAEEEPWGSVRFVGPSGQVADDLLPYQETQAELVNGEEYSAPLSVIEKLVLNSAFEPADDAADEALSRLTRKSQLGVKRARRLLAAPAAGGETARAFDRRVGISAHGEEFVEGVRHSSVEPEQPEFDPEDDEDEFVEEEN